MKRYLIALVLAVAAARLSSAFDPPRGLEIMPLIIPPDNLMTDGKIKLGEQLFFDKRLSKTQKMSCETCHLPEKGWTDGQKFSTKADGSLNTRNTPTLYGVGFYPDLDWDGRLRGLEAQIRDIWKDQMSADPDAVAKELDAIPAYKAAFQSEFGGPPTGERIVKALATFARTIHAGDTAYDRMGGDPQAIETSDVGQGFRVFSGEVARCTNCHLPPVFSDTIFHNVGIGFDTAKPDPGRGKALADEAAKNKESVPEEAERLTGAFKTPTLRGVSLTAPYFHDGRAATLEQAVDLMLKGGIKNPHRDDKLQPIKITAKQRKQLLAFLKALTPDPKPYPRPARP